MNVKLNIFVIFLVVALTALLAFYWEMRPPPQEIHIYPPPKADAGHDAAIPAFAFETIDGKSFDIEDFRGKAVLLNFWASWCPPCIAEFPVLLEMAQNYPDELVLLAFSSDRDVPAIQSFIKRLGPAIADKIRARNVLIIWDKNMHITQELFDVFQLPETFLITPDGEIAHKFIGVDWTAEDMQARIDAVLED